MLVSAVEHVDVQHVNTCTELSCILRKPPYPPEIDVLLADERCLWKTLETLRKLRGKR